MTTHEISFEEETQSFGRTYPITLQGRVSHEQFGWFINQATQMYAAQHRRLRNVRFAYAAFVIISTIFFVLIAFTPLLSLAVGTEFLYYRGIFWIVFAAAYVVWMLFFFLVLGITIMRIKSIQKQAKLQMDAFVEQQNQALFYPVGVQFIFKYRQWLGYRHNGRRQLYQIPYFELIVLQSQIQPVFMAAPQPGIVVPPTTNSFVAPQQPQPVLYGAAQPAPAAPTSYYYQQDPHAAPVQPYQQSTGVSSGGYAKI